MKRKRALKRVRKRDSINVKSTQDLDECARLYIKNVFSSYAYKPKVKIKKLVYTPGEDFTLINPKSSGLKKITKLKNPKEFEGIINKSFNHPSTASSLFESVFETIDGNIDDNRLAKYRLNSNVIKPGAIVRVWTTLDRVDGNESHAVVTIDYKNRRVSFDTSNPDNVKIGLKGKNLPGVGHCIASPQASFVKKLARVYFDNKEYFETGRNKASLSRLVKLKAMGVLDGQHIKRLRKYLIELAINMEFEYTSDIYTKHNDDYFAIQPIFRISTTLYYSRASNIIYNTSKAIQFHIEQDEDRKIVRNSSNMSPINCSSFVELLFPDIVFRANTLTLSMLEKVKFIPTAPSMLRPTYDYLCLDTSDNQIDNVRGIKNKRLEIGPGVEYNLIKTTGIIGYAQKKYGSVAAYIIDLAIALGTFILWAFPWATILGMASGSYLIIPLEYHLYITDINISSILNNITEIFSSSLCGVFGFNIKCDKNSLSIQELKEKYGEDKVNHFLQLFRAKKYGKELKLKFSTKSHQKKSRRRKSVKKSRRRRSVKKSRRRRSVKKSRRRRSVKKSRRRRSVKKSRRRRSVKKSRRRRSVKKSRRRRSVKKSRRKKIG